MASPPLILALLACGGAPLGDDTGRDTAPSDDTAPPDAPLTLADADASVLGTPSSGTGSAVEGLGDLDGDGRPEVVVAAFYANRACVFAGPLADGARPLADGACLDGERVYDFAGYDVAPVSLDGAPGLAVTAIGDDDAGIEAGKVYVLAGLPAPGAHPLADAPLVLLGEAAGDYAGTAVASAGDTDGDGLAELLVGASGADAGGSGGGRVYLLPASGSGVVSLAEAPISFTGASGAPAAFAHGAATGGDALGDAVAGLGDLDGDGFDDLLLGASGSASAGAGTGEAWILRGPIAPGDHRADDADVRLFGPGPNAFAGGAVAGPGDLDGDGLADALVAADGWDGGRVFVFLGPIDDGAYSLEQAPTALAGEVAEDAAGWAVSGAGDTDGDGRREVLVGAPGHGANDEGAIYLVRAPTVPGVLDLGAHGVAWAGESGGDAAGRAAAGAGDTDGDGLDDLLVGALYNQQGGSFAGKAYLLRGR